MGPFQFRLAKALNWRNSQRQLEHNRLAASYAALFRIEEALKQLRASQLETERLLLAGNSISAPELHALEEHRRLVRAQEVRLRQDIERCQRELGIQIDRLKAAQLKVRLLEKLQERRLTEHTEAMNRELEDLASDTHLAKFAREL